MRRLEVLTLTILIFLSGLVLPIDASAIERESRKSTLTVFAASSLSKTFLRLSREFTKLHPGVNVRFSFLSSSTLAMQINSGAPADLFASASEKDMVNAKSQVPTPKIFTGNRIVLATPKQDSFNIRKISDLNMRGLKWIQCSHSAPCGAVSDLALAAEGSVKSKPVSLEQKVANVVAKLISGEVDAALIYHTDYLAHKRVLREIAFKDSNSATTFYYVGVVKSSPMKALAQSFMDLLLSAKGRKALRRDGYLSVTKRAE